MAQRFSGWSPDAVAFFEELTVDNSKAFFDANRERFDTEVKAPFARLSEEVADEFGPLRTFRIHRDVRFSKDKSPYKTQLGAVTEGEGGEIYYCHISAEGLFCASGYHMMAKDQLARFRAALDGPDGPRLGEVMARLPSSLTINDEDLKRAPKGFSPDHPQITWLRRKGLTASRAFAPSARLSQRHALTMITDSWRAAAPMNDWLNAHVGPSEAPPEDRPY